MNTSMESLWSPEIKPGIMSPRDILDQQAMALRDQSGGALLAEVREAHDKGEGSVYLIFDIVAPSLDGARHRILTARHFVDRIYPCHLDADGLRSAEVAHSELDFRELIRQVLHSGEVKSLALSLLARIRDTRKADEAEVVTRRDLGHKRPFRRPAWVGVELDEDHLGVVEALYDESHGGD